MVKTLSKRYLMCIFFVVFVSVALFFLTLTNVSAQEYPPGMVSYWKLDEVEGITAFDAVGTNDGIVFGATWTTGQVNGALSFDGNDYVEIADEPSLRPANAVSVETWVKVDSIPDGQAVHIIDRNSSEGGKPFEGYALTSYGYGPYVFWLWTNPNNPTQTGAIGTTYFVGDCKFHHVVGTYDGFVVKVYVDGVLEGSAPASGSIVYASELNLWLGANQQPSPYPRYVQGIIDEVAVYNRALTPEEIQQHYQYGLDGLGYETPILPPVAVAGTSLDGNDMLQLDGTLSSNPQSDPLIFSWQIEGEASPRTGQIASIADLPVGNYQVTLSASNSAYTETDTMLFAVPEESGIVPPPTDELQAQILDIKDKISNFSTSSFDAPNDKAANNRRKAILNMLDKVSEHIEVADFQAAVDQMEDILVKSDAISPPDSPPDWIIDDPSTEEIHEQQEIAQLGSNLISDLETLL